ncbi:MAG: OmpA family protein [bacterium]|nr:OmpA family protein [bacterium]
MMRRQLFLCTAITALLAASPAQAQYIDRYRPSEKPQVEINLDVLNDRQEQEYNARTAVVQEPLPVSQPPAMPAQTVDAMPESVAQEISAPAAPAQKRKLLKPVLTTPTVSEEAPEEAATADEPAPVAESNGITADGEMPQTQTIVKHVLIRSYSPVDDMPAQSAAVDEIYRQSAMEDMAASITPVTPVEHPTPLPRRKPVMGEAKPAEEKPEPVRMAALSGKVVPTVASDAPEAQVAGPEQKDEPKIEVAATEVAPDVKAEEPKASETSPVETAKAEEIPAPVVTTEKPETPNSEEPKTAEAEIEAAPAPVQMAQADIPQMPAARPAKNRIISQPPEMKEQTLQPLLPRTSPASKPIVSAPPRVAAPVAPVRPATPVVPKMAAQPIAPVAADPLPDATPVAPVEQAAPATPVAPVAETAPAQEPVPENAAARPPLEIVAPPLADVNEPSEPQETAMPVVPVIDDLTLGFPGNSSDLTGESQKKLDAVIRQMADMIEGRLQVRGYASGEDGSQSSARRIALSRALAVRSYLMDKGIKPNRVDVKAAGSETDRQPLDRVDLIFAR